MTAVSKARSAREPAVPAASPANRPGQGVAAALVLAVGISVLFWSQYWSGEAMIGGDIYPYYLPQKVTYAEALAAGRLPLWNNLVGHGYPQLAESQTGVFYPPHLLAYSLLPTQRAYDLVQLGHYIVAFLTAWLCAARFGLSPFCRLLAALVYTYGWFPPRLCLEWAIIGGAWLPLAVYGTMVWWQDRRLRALALVTGALTLQLLAGHFYFAFATLLAVAAASLAECRGKPAGSPSPTTTFSRPPGHPRSLLSGVCVAVSAAFLLAAAQLLPTWELKQLSQRAEVSATFDPGYGSIPPLYLTQVFGFWVWYFDDIELDRLLPPGASGTNSIEAHLFFGTIPLVLFAAALIDPEFWSDRRRVVWLLLAASGVVLAIDAIPAFTRRVPGFSFFSGPGRYGVLTTLAVGLIASWKLDRLLQIWTVTAPVDAKGLKPSSSRWRFRLLKCVLLAVTTYEFLAAGRLVNNVSPLLRSPLELRPESPVRQLLLAEPGPVRLLCRGANVATLLGVASTPVYLGIGPAAYSDPARKLPDPVPFDVPPTSAQIDWLRRASVTHILSFDPLSEVDWPVTLVKVLPDRFLSEVWSRPSSDDPEPDFYVYRLNGARPRVSWQPAVDEHATASVLPGPPEEVAITATSRSGGRLVLTDLDYPGWEVKIDGAPARPEVFEGMYRSVELPPGEHLVRWTYRPRSVWLGLAISLLTAAALALLVGLRWRAGRNVCRPLETESR